MLRDEKMAPYELYLVDALGLNDVDLVDEQRLIAGVVEKVTVRPSRNGPFVTIQLNSNDENVTITMWNSEYEKYKEQLSGSKGKIIMSYSKIVYDAYRGQNVQHTNRHSIIKII